MEFHVYMWWILGVVDRFVGQQEQDTRKYEGGVAVMGSDYKLLGLQFADCDDV